MTYRGVRGEDVMGFEGGSEYGRHEGRDAAGFGSERGDNVGRKAKGKEVGKHNCVAFFDGGVKRRGCGERGVP